MSIFSPAILPHDGYFGAELAEDGMDDTTDRYPAPHDDILMVRPSGEFSDGSDGEFLDSFNIRTQDGSQNVFGQIARFNGRFQSAKWVLNLQAESDVFRVFVPERNMVCANRTTLVVFEQRFSSIPEHEGYAARLIDLEDGSTIWRVTMDPNPVTHELWWRPSSEFLAGSGEFLTEDGGILLFQSGNASEFDASGNPVYPGLGHLLDSNFYDNSFNGEDEGDSFALGNNAHVARSTYYPTELITGPDIEALSQGERDARDTNILPSVLLTSVGRPLIQATPTLAYYDGTERDENTRIDTLTGQPEISFQPPSTPEDFFPDRVITQPRVDVVFTTTPLPGNSIITIDSDRNVVAHPLDPGVRRGNLSLGFAYRAGSSYVNDQDLTTFQNYLRVYSGWPTAANFVREYEIPSSRREIPGARFSDADVFRRRFYGGAVVSPAGNYIGGFERRDDLVWTLDPP